MAITAIEIETHLSQSADDHTKWELFTEDQPMIRKMARLGIEPSRQVGRGFAYQLTADQVVIRKGKKTMSEKQRAAAAARMSAMQSKKRMPAQNGTTLPDREPAL